MISASQGTSTNGGSSINNMGGSFIDPTDVRDAAPARIWWFLSPMQLR